MELIDIGCNLAHEAFDADRDVVLERAKEAGVAVQTVYAVFGNKRQLVIELTEDAVRGDEETTSVTGSRDGSP